MVSSLHWDEKQLRRRCSHSLAQSSKLGQALQLFTDMPCFGMNYFLKETAHWQNNCCPEKYVEHGGADVILGNCQ